MTKDKKFTFTIQEEKGRVDKVLTTFLPEYSRSQVQEWIAEGDVLLNGEMVKANYKVQSGDKITLTIPPVQETETVAENIPLEIVYEDEDVVVINKPQGMVVHPAAGHPSGTLVNALLYHIKDLSGINGIIRPGIVHRLDKDTSGLLMVAKNDHAHESLAKQLKERTALREYVALVHGVVPHDEASIEAPIGRSPHDRRKHTVIENGKDSVTHFNVLERFPDYTLLSVRLETGRTHQIRVHMEYIGFPMVGDVFYGRRKTIKGNGQFLHAKKIGFTHPTTGEEMVFEADLPEIFKETLDDIRDGKI